MRTFGAAAALAAIMTMWTTRVAAAPKIGADVEAAIAVTSVTSPSVGFGGGLRLGYELRLPLISITPEVGVSYTRFGSGADTARIVGGGRVGLGEVLRPGVFAHLGYETAGAGPTFDGGGFLDFTLLPVFDIGVHVAYVVTPAVNWLSPGLHASFSF